jgi:hypothetical protein
MKGIIKSKLITCFDIKRIVHKEFVLACQTVISHTAVTFYGLRENVRDFAPNFGDKITGCTITTTHCLTRPSSPGNFFTKHNMTVVSQPPYSSLFPRSKIKLRDRHFDTTEVIEAESQAVLNTLIEHNFQDAIQNGGARWQHQSRKLWMARYTYSRSNI